MLAFTKKTDYALLALTHLARVGPELASARKISQEFGTPLPLLMNILKTLHQQGLVTSVRGAKGGYQLACRPEEISIASLIRAIEGPVSLTRCAEDDGQMGSGPCDLGDRCPLRTPLGHVQDRVERLLSGITIAELADSHVHEPVGRAGHRGDRE